MTDEFTIIEGSGNVFVDLGFPHGEEHQTKAHLVGQIADILEERHMTQTAAAKVFGISQPKVSAMLNGQFRGFSVYRLMNFITSLGHDVEIITTAPRLSKPEEAGHIFVR